MSNFFRISEFLNKKEKGDESSQRRFLALGIDLCNEPCLVIGGGNVGAWKTGILLRHGAKVTVVAPRIDESLQALVDQKGVEWKATVYSSDLLGDAFFVVAATSDRELNELIAHDAREAGKLCCQTSSASSSQVLFPALYEFKEMVVAVHSQGRDCSRTKQIRNKIANYLKAEE